MRQVDDLSARKGRRSRRRWGGRTGRPENPSITAACLSGVSTRMSSSSFSTGGRNRGQRCTSRNAAYKHPHRVNQSKTLENTTMPATAITKRVGVPYAWSLRSGGIVRRPPASGATGISRLRKPQRPERPQRESAYGKLCSEREQQGREQLDRSTQAQQNEANP